MGEDFITLKNLPKEPQLFWSWSCKAANTGGFAPLAELDVLAFGWGSGVTEQSRILRSNGLSPSPCPCCPSFLSFRLCLLRLHPLDCLPACEGSLWSSSVREGCEGKMSHVVMTPGLPRTPFGWKDRVHESGAMPPSNLSPEQLGASLVMSKLLVEPLALCPPAGGVRGSRQPSSDISGDCADDQNWSDGCGRSAWRVSLLLQGPPPLPSQTSWHTSKDSAPSSSWIGGSCIWLFRGLWPFCSLNCWFPLMNLSCRLNEHLKISLNSADCFAPFRSSASGPIAVLRDLEVCPRSLRLLSAQLPVLLPLGFPSSSPSALSARTWTSFLSWKPTAFEICLCQYQCRARHFELAPGPPRLTTPPKSLPRSSFEVFSPSVSSCSSDPLLGLDPKPWHKPTRNRFEVVCCPLSAGPLDLSPSSWTRRWRQDVADELLLLPGQKSCRSPGCERAAVSLLLPPSRLPRFVSIVSANRSLRLPANEALKNLRLISNSLYALFWGTYRHCTSLLAKMAGSLWTWASARKAACAAARLGYLRKDMPRNCPRFR